MMFEETYRTMNTPIGPSPALVEKTLAADAKRRSLPRLALAAACGLLCLCIAVPVAAATVEPVYQILYLLSPAAAQLFQPVRLTASDNGVTMEVVSIQVAGDTAQACLALTGETVDETTDLYDSYSFHVPFDQTSHCERVGFDPETRTVFFW